MCLALYIPKGKTVSKQRLQDAHNANPDGWGVVFSGGDRIVCHKRIGDFKSFWFDFKVIRHGLFDRIVHFRTASSGSIGIEYCHPFYVNENLAFVQNGNLPEYANGFGYSDSRTDIQRFNLACLRRLDSNFLHIPEIRNALEKYSKECFSKMIFMDNEGNVDIINESAGEWVDGVWFSNGGIEDYTGYGYSGAYYYNADDIRHKGGLISVQMFSEERRKKWSQCSKCQGYFRNEVLKAGKCQGCNTLDELLRFTI